MSEPAWLPFGPAATYDVGPEVAYQEYTAQTNITATTEAGAQNVVAAPAFVADGISQYLVEFFAPIATPAAGSSSFLNCVLFLDGVSLGWMGGLQNASATALGAPLRLTRRITPAAGSRVFSVRGYVNTGTGILYGSVGGVGSYVPGFIRITKVPSAVVAPGMGLVPPTAIGTALPASPVDGQEFILTDSLTAPTFTWRLRYVAAKASNKWVFVGGSPRYAEVLTTEVMPSTGAYVALATPGPSIAIPVAGDYIIAHGARLQNDASGFTSRMSYDIGATAAVDADSVVCSSQPNGASGDAGMSVATERRKSLGAVTLTAKFKAATTSWWWADRYIEATPIAIGG